MSRRRKTPEPESAAWESYRPTEARYWFYGGPWIPPEEITPGGNYMIKAAKFATHLKDKARADHVAKVLAKEQADLTRETVYYCALHGQGYKALRYDWQRERYEQNNVKLDEPSALHYALANTYQAIAEKKANVPVLDRLLASLERYTSPLFHWK